MSEISDIFYDRFNIDEAVHVIYRKLAKERDLSIIQLEDESSLSKKSMKDIDPINFPFSTMKDVFIWSACLGFRSGKRKPITGKRKLIFRWAQLNPQTDIPLLKAIAIADSGDVQVLLNQKEIVTIAEEYANAGIYELRESVLGERDLPLWNLVSMLNQYANHLQKQLEE